MKITFRVIASGSNGNAAYISTPDGIFLVDAGISRKRIIDALKQDGLSPNKVIGILVSHSHTDHCRGLPVLCNIINSSIYCTADTRKALYSLGRIDPRWKEISDNANILSFDAPYKTGKFTILPMRTVHDIQGSAAFQIDYNKIKISVITDTGKITPEHIQSMQESSIVLLESNHDTDSLFSSRRPYWLKKRIRATHLANNESRATFNSLLGSSVKALFLGHLSGECNSPDLVTNEVSIWQASKEVQWKWFICQRDRPGELVELDRNRLKIKTQKDEFSDKQNISHFIG
ncbi:MAG: MBL fold metallo-hydrolase [Candidatus Hodarchaeales archaeon]